MNENSQGWYGQDAATLGDRITAAREAAGMSSEQLAKRLGIKKSTLRKWEDDIAEPRANRLSMMAGLLNVSVMWLINGEGDGIEGPDFDPMQGQAGELILEARELKAEMQRATERLGRLEKRLRTLLNAEA